MLVVLFAVLVPSVVAQCSFSGGDISARWQVADNELTVEFVNKKIGNNQWTGIGFGSSMENLEVVLVKIQDNKPFMVTGYTSGYSAPKLDSSTNVSPKLLSFNTNQLTFRFTRSLGVNGARSHSLEGCQKWNFVKEGRLEGGEISQHVATPVQIEVCPNECKDSIIHD
ncbi:unnamed protein product [Heligmosomoides polygyrus]|uniref:DOMON domain-containing protein n=1 Tax=Heligmosomoides polygyrus TaxID=6339 RepID=A0A183FZU8_HELPZ|nr:unnamed protein product [Heligmosomoides polygyrus]